MRPLEIIIFVLNALNLVLFLVPAARRRAWVAFLPVLTLLVVIAHLLLEKPRWQMAPVYLFTVALVLLTQRGWQRASSGQSGYLRWGWVVAGLVVLALFGSLPALLPVPALPKPTGPFQVGTQTFFWVDNKRDETFGPGVNGKRGVMVQVWYPAAPKAGERLAPYMENADIGGPAVAKVLHLPAFSLSHVKLVKTHAYIDAPLAGDLANYPVLVFSHGWDGMRVQNTYQMEELASHGYIVFAPDHAYGAAFTVFPDGSVALNNPSLLPQGVSAEEYQQAINRLGAAWTGDIHYVLDQAEKLNSGAIASQFSGRLDLNRVGFLGHSTGGGAAVEACWDDARCKAVLGMDAWLEPYSRAMLDQGVGKPFLSLRSDLWLTGNNASLTEQLLSHHQAETYDLTIKGTRHYDFSDIPLFTPLAPYMGLKGPINGPRDIAIIRAYTIAFFDQALEKLPENLLKNTPAGYPEVKAVSK